MPLVLHNNVVNKIVAAPQNRTISRRKPGQILTNTRLCPPFQRILGLQHYQGMDEFCTCNESFQNFIIAKSLAVSRARYPTL
jgi:hypothetical protein